MATKNKNIKTYDLNSVFDEYMITISRDLDQQRAALTEQIAELNTEIESQTNELNELKEYLKNKKNARLDSRKSTDMKIGLENLKNSLNNDKLTDEEKQAIQAQIDALNVKINETIDAENKKYNEEQAKIDSKYKAEFAQAQAISSSIKELKTAAAELEAELQKLPTSAIANLESFTSFLTENNLSTVHAEELFNHLTKSEKLAKISENEFTMRKMHPTRDYVIKKVVVPTAITSVAIGATIGAIAGTGLVGGSEILGFIPVSGTPGLTEMATTVTGAVAGLVATPIVIKTKNLITKAYYRLKSQSAAKNVEDYNDGTDIANIRASKLMAKIEETQHAILSSNGPFNLIRKIINRNRIHQIVDYTIDLYKIYHEIESDQSVDAKLKAETLKPIYEMLTNVEEFITNDIAEEITYSLLTCKEDKKDHHHTYMIENVDIYARLKITLDKIARVNAEHSMDEQLQNAKNTTKDLVQKKQEAYKLISGEKPITGVLNFEKKYAKYVASPSQGIAVMKREIDEDKKVVTLTLANGKKVSIPASEIDTTKRISTIKIGRSKSVITYKDGSTQEIAKKVKIVPEIETARIALVDKLMNDQAFIEELKAEGFKTITITKLVEKINEWRAHTDEKFAVSGKIKTLYTYAIEKINTETELVQSV